MKLKEEIFQTFITERNIAKNTITSYEQSLNKYTTHTNQKLTELIEEADNEEEQGIRLKKRQIKNKLITFRTQLINKNYTKKSINTIMSHITSFYTHFEIETPKLPPFRLKQYEETFEDIPQIEHIKSVIESTGNLQYKAVILFMASSGTARNETMKLTCQDFINATKDYHNSEKLKNVLKELEGQKDIVPLWKMYRDKTNNSYYTCSSPESTDAFIKFLKNENILNNNEKIFKVKIRTINEFFRYMNIKLGFHKKPNGRYFFTPHALRKFHATVIEDVGFANTLQGRKADMITETYFKHDPKRIKEKYLEHLPKLTINETIVNKVDDEATKELKEEIKQLRKEKEDMEEIIYNRVMEKFNNLPP